MLKIVMWPLPDKTKLKIMLERLKKRSGATIEEKCEHELEVKYTKMLTREFCLGWIRMHQPEEGHRASLVLNNPASVASPAHEFRLDISEKDILSGNLRSLHCCLIYAMDVEGSLKLELSEGNGACIFVK